MENFEASRRTRFLAALDRMIEADGKGAVDDMLQVLREVGAIKTVGASDLQDERRLKTEGYRDAMRRHIAGVIANFLVEQGEIRFSESASTSRAFTYGDTVIVGEVDVVVAAR